MTTAPLWKQYIAALVPFIVIDLLWLGLVAKRFYRRELGALMRQPVSWGAALAFYLLYPLGLAIFVIPQALAVGAGAGLPIRPFDLLSLVTSGVGYAFVYGALFGLFTYGTYDLTNRATLRGFSTKLALVDWLWGTLLTGTVAAIATALLLGR